VSSTTARSYSRSRRRPGSRISFPTGSACASGVPLTVVAGAENRDTWLGAAASWLVEGTGADRVELPGGQVGFVTHPEQLVALAGGIGGRR
jgi:hypothetical protein